MHLHLTWSLFVLLVNLVPSFWALDVPSEASQYVLAPVSRSVQPSAIYRTTGNVSVLPSANATSPGPMVRLTGAGSSVTYDFGRQVAGVPSIFIADSRCAGGTCSNLFGLPSFDCSLLCQGLGLAYSESAAFIGEKSDNSILYSHVDDTLYLPMAPGPYQVPSKWGRGGFRYLTLSLGNGTAASTTVAFSFTSLHYTPAPGVQDPAKLGSYTGYFHSSDALLNRIWYAGVHTLQLCTVAANSSVNHVFLVQPKGWSNDASAKGLAATDAYLSDGAKRDRNPWAGDIGVSLRSALVSQNIGNLRALKLALQESLVLQDTNFLSPTRYYFPYAGSPLGDLLVQFGSVVGLPVTGSDTYHLWTIIGFAEYVLATGDLSWGQEHWSQIVNGLSATYGFVDTSTGLFNGTRSLDWGRIGQGGQNVALNALYYYAIRQTLRISPMMPQRNESQEQAWATMADEVKSSSNALLYDPAMHLYTDNKTAAGSHVHPEDGNTFAINFGLTKSPEHAKQVAEALAARHTKYGAPTPELPDSIAPFVSSQELLAQFAAHPGNATAALSLMRTQWSYMLDAFSNSTFIEGYGSDGSLKYGFYPNGGAFISHTHSWSTGPVYSLMRHIVGLSATPLDVETGDGDWAFRPSVLGSSLSFVDGGFETERGDFTASWELGQDALHISLSTPAGTYGAVYVPLLGLDAMAARVTIDGEQPDGAVVDGYLRVASVAGGEHRIELKLH